MAVKTILPVCNAYKRAQHPPIKAEVFQNVVFGQIQSRHIIGNRQILRRSFNHAPLNETSGRGPTRKLRTVSGKGPVSALRRHSTRGSGSSAHPPHRRGKIARRPNSQSVSYTHLTLPTIYSV